MDTKFALLPLTDFYVLLHYMDGKHSGYQTELVRPSWIKGRPFIEAVNTDTTIALVKGIAKRYDRPVFDSSPQAVEYALALRLPTQKS